jgi:uncharacterized membrane protein
MNATRSTSHRLVEVTQRLEGDERLDRLTRAIEPLAQAVRGGPQRDHALRGMWLGHAVHPLMTDFPLGMWTAATALDLLAGADSRPAARRLIGLGIATAVPTALTGLAEWGATSSPRVRRTGAVHAVANSTALVLYITSYAARRRGRQGAGIAVGLLAGVAATVGGYFGGHLTEVRNVSSYHPDFDQSPGASAADPESGD